MDPEHLRLVHTVHRLLSKPWISYGPLMRRRTRFCLSSRHCLSRRISEPASIDPWTIERRHRVGLVIFDLCVYSHSISCINQKILDNKKMPFITTQNSIVVNTLSVSRLRKVEFTMSLNLDSPLRNSSLNKLVVSLLSWAWAVNANCSMMANKMATIMFINFRFLRRPL